MQLETVVIVKVLICLFICISNGAPPKEVGAGYSNARFNKYTNEEDKFIVTELTSLLEVPYTYKIWNKITERHNEKWKAGTPGFPQERCSSSIRSRFWDVLLKNPSNVEAKVPEILREKLLNSNQKAKGLLLAKERSSEKGKYAVYSKQEDDLILEELRKPSCTNILGLRTMETIRKEYEKKRQAGINGFENERSADSLRMRVSRLRQRNLLPRDLLEKSSVYQGPRHSYTAEEDELIIKELSKQSQSTLFNKAAVKSICAELDRKRTAKIPGFENERTVGSLTSHIGVMRDRGLLPDELAKNYTLRRRALSNALGISCGEPSHTHHPSQQTDSQTAEVRELSEKETAEWVDELFDDTEFEFVCNNHHSFVEE